MILCTEFKWSVLFSLFFSSSFHSLHDASSCADEIYLLLKYTHTPRIENPIPSTFIPFDFSRWICNQDDFGDVRHSNDVFIFDMFRLRWRRRQKIRERQTLKCISTFWFQSAYRKRAPFNKAKRCSFVHDKIFGARRSSSPQPIPFHEMPTAYRFNGSIFRVFYLFIPIF